MKYYPICLDIKGRRCLVVGGGQVATRKVGTLLACGAYVTVVSPEVTSALVQLAEEDRIALKQRAYRSSDLETMFLVIGATDNENLNRRIHADAETRQCLCNIADQPHLCNFILPAVVQQGDLVITISTSGRSPAFAKYLRHQMQDWFGPEYALFLELMGAVRERLLAVEHAPEVHKPLFEKLIQGRLPELIKTDDRSAIDALLTEVLGKGFTYADLMTKE